LRMFKVLAKHTDCGQAMIDGISDFAANVG
jgi:hypothetical protein